MFSAAARTAALQRGQDLLAGSPGGKGPEGRDLAGRRSRTRLQHCRAAWGVVAVSSRGLRGDQAEGSCPSRPWDAIAREAGTGD